MHRAYLTQNFVFEADLNCLSLAPVHVQAQASTASSGPAVSQRDRPHVHQRPEPDQQTWHSKRQHYRDRSEHLCPQLE